MAGHWIHNLNPILIRTDSFQLSYYWASYFVCYLSAVLLTWRLCKEKRVQLPTKDILHFYLYAWIGVIVGARLGHVIFYRPEYYLSQPSLILSFWKGGMAFYGALTGVFICIWIHCKWKNISLLHYLDIIAIVAPCSIFIGRIANFIQSDCIGKPTNLPWGIIFPKLDSLPRHPTQLYEAYFQGLILFAILWLRRDSLQKPGTSFVTLFMGYSIFRFVIEFVKEPYTTQLFALGPLNISQILCVFLFMIGYTVYRAAPIKKQL